ncbi:hypothetical protein GGI12_003019 [Dipsacomyces acuminosporus]|nr:hypothetical protein GGI12_003019 [Dipsacomyces acuminosporus]
MLALSFGSFNSRLFMREALHTLLAWCVLVVVVLWMALCQEWSDMRWLRAQWAHQHHHKGAPTNGGFGTKAWFGSLFGVRSDDRPIPTGAITAQPLEDLFLDNLPYLTQSWISEALVNSAALISIVGGLLMIKGWQAKLVLLRRVAWMMAILYFIRSITISVTTLPPSVADCKPTVARNSREMLSAVLSMLSGKAGECTDKIFSGHTTTLFISFLFWSRYARHWSLIVYSALHTFLGIASVLLMSMGGRALAGHDSKIKKLRTELDERLEELKKKTAFDTTKTLIDRYSARSKNAPNLNDAASRLKQQERDLRNRRRTMPNFGTPATDAANKAGSLPTSPLAIKSMQRGQLQQHNALQLPQQPSGSNAQSVGSNSLVNSPQRPTLDGRKQQIETGVVRIAPRSPASVSSPNSASLGSSRPWLDKLVDQLVGDVGSTEDKYALICRHCYAHNGLVLEEEIQDIQYNCPKCGKFNESVRALREKKNSTGRISSAPGSALISRLSSQSNVGISDIGESGYEEEEFEDEEEQPEEHQQLPHAAIYGNSDFKDGDGAEHVSDNKPSTLADTSEQQHDDADEDASPDVADDNLDETPTTSKPEPVDLPSTPTKLPKNANKASPKKRKGKGKPKRT